MSETFRPFEVDEMAAYVAAVVAPLWRAEGWPNVTGLPPTPGEIYEGVIKAIWALLSQDWELGQDRYLDHQRLRFARDSDGVIRVFLEICDNWDYPYYPEEDSP